MIVTMMSSASTLVIIPWVFWFFLYPSAMILEVFFVKNLQEQILSPSSNAKIMA